MKEGTSNGNDDDKYYDPLMDDDDDDANEDEEAGKVGVLLAVPAGPTVAQQSTPDGKDSTILPQIGSVAVLHGDDHDDSMINDDHVILELEQPTQRLLQVDEAKQDLEGIGLTNK